MNLSKDFINKHSEEISLSAEKRISSEKIKSLEDKEFYPKETPSEKAKNRAIVKGMNEDTSSKEANRVMRTNISDFSMLVTIVSLCIWIGVILFQAIGKMNGIEMFSDIQFATITTGCTVNILAVILGVIRGLFK